VIATRRLQGGVWLGISQPPAPLDLVGRVRRLADQAAARRALAAARCASNRRLAGFALSLSHSRGAGAALIGPAGSSLGVDVVLAGRIGSRHAQAILAPSEWQAVRQARITPALCWAIKEATAKATGVPERASASRLRIAVGDRSGVHVRWLDEPARWFAARWERWGPFLYAWVLEGDPGRNGR
jgi:phosphopantetheinyl transferase